MSVETITDVHARGFTSGDVTPARYRGFASDPLESHGTALTLIPKGSRVLDVGCGTADFAVELRDRLGCDVVGIEPHEARATLARSQGISVFTGLLTAEFVKRTDPYDVVCFMDVLEHTADPTSLLSIASTGLDKNGIIIVSVPNVAHWTVRRELLAGRFDYQPAGIMDATHLRWFTATTIRNVAEAAGLAVTWQGVTRGTWLGVYNNNRPWKYISAERRRRMLDRLCAWRPCLFGCQHVLVLMKAQQPTYDAT